MTSNKNRKTETRRIGELLGIKYTDAARVVAAQDAGDLPKLPPEPVITVGEYDPLFDTVNAFLDVVPVGQSVLVATAPLIALTSELTWNLGEVEPGLSPALGAHLGLGDDFDTAAPTNRVDRNVAERLLDLCCAVAGPKLDAIEDYMFRGQVSSSFLKAVLEGAAALDAALTGRHAGDTVQVAQRLQARLGTLTEHR